MKKFIAYSIIAAASPLAFAQSNPVSTLQGGAQVSGDTPTLIPEHTTTLMNGGVVEDKTIMPELSLDLLSVSASVGYESAYVFRGEKLAGHSICPEVEFAYPIYDFDIYAGAWYSSPVRGDAGGLEELDLYAGVNYYLGALRLDVGYIYYWYPSTSVQAAGDITRDMEVYFGACLDTSAYLGVNINPSVYYWYNWILKQQTVEISLGHEFPVGEWTFGNEKLTLPVSIYGGYSSAGRKNGDNGGPDEGVSYFYYGVRADLAYALTDYCTVSGGIRYSYRNGGNEGDVVDHYGLLGREHNFWFGGSVSFGF